MPHIDRGEEANCTVLYVEDSGDVRILLSTHTHSREVGLGWNGKAGEAREKGLRRGRDDIGPSQQTNVDCAGAPTSGSGQAQGLRLQRKSPPRTLGAGMRGKQSKQSKATKLQTGTGERGKLRSRVP